MSIPVASDMVRNSGGASAFNGGAWADTILAADFTHGNNTFSTITGFTYTPPANTNFEIEASLLIWTTSAANLPRIGVNVAAGAAAGYGAIKMEQTGATATTVVDVAGSFNNPGAAVNVQHAVGGVLTASTPWLSTVRIRGRSGATPTAISIQMACETGAANTCYVKQGSRMSTRAT